MLSGDNEAHTVLLSWVLTLTHPGLGTLDINHSQLSGVAIPAARLHRMDTVPADVDW
jgi:hypothetical protein